MEDNTDNIFDFYAGAENCREIKALKEGLGLAALLLGGTGKSLKSLCGIYAELHNACTNAENEFEAEKFECAYRYVAEVLIDSAMLGNGYVKCDGRYCSTADK